MASSRLLIVPIVAMAAAAASGMIYELAIATVSGYVLGDNVTHFSLVVGLFLFAMGIGAALSRNIRDGLLPTFLVIEIWLGFFGILACPSLLYIGFVFEYPLLSLAAMLIITGSIGIFVGLEIPILSRYLETFSGSRRALSNVLAADYIGSLAGAVAFPLLLLPNLGLIGTSALAGFLNVAVAVLVIAAFRRQVAHPARYLAGCLVIALGLGGIAAVRQPLFDGVEDRGYRDKVIFREQTPYQRIVLTRGVADRDRSTAVGPQAGYLPRRWKDDFRLFLDGHLQFSSLDEYRYHETLIHLPMSLHAAPGNVLVLGGGDGLAVAEIFKYPSVEAVTLVELDTEIVKIAQKNKDLRKINKDALLDPRLHLIIGDAFTWIRNTGEDYDVIVADFPDPHSPVLSRLYSAEFYAMVRRRLRPGGVFVTQSSSPYFARKAFWSVRRSLEAARFAVVSYHVDVPAFGDWGFHLAARQRPDIAGLQLHVPTRYLTNDLIPSLFVFGKDVAPVPVKVNTLTNMKLFSYYQDGDWEEY